MPTVVEIPGHGPVEFPDSMTADQINAAAKKLHDASAGIDPKAAMRTAAPAGGALKSALQLEGRHPIPAPPGGFKPEDPANVYWRDERAKYSKLPASERALTGAATALTRLASGVAGLAPFEIPGFTDKQGKDTLALMDYMTHGDLPSAAGGVAADVGASLLPLARGSKLASTAIGNVGRAATEFLPKTGTAIQWMAPIAGDALALAGYNAATTPGDADVREEIGRAHV